MFLFPKTAQAALAGLGIAFAIRLSGAYITTANSSAISPGENSEQELAKIESLGRAIATNPRDLDAIILRGQLLLKHGEEEAALKDLNRALTLTPDDTNLYGLYVDRAIVYEHSGRFENALSDLGTAMQLIPDRVEALDNRALLLKRIGRWTESDIDYQTAIERNPFDYRSFYGRSSERMLARNLEGAASDLRQAMALEPKRPDLKLGYSWCLLEQGNPQAALAEAARASSFGASESESLLVKVSAFLALGNYAEMRTNLTRLEALRPTDGNVVVQSAECMFLSGKLSEADHEYERAGKLTLSVEECAYVQIRRRLLALKMGKAGNNERWFTKIAGENAEWLNAIADLLDGNITASALENKAESSASNKSGYRKAEAYYYAGDFALSKSHRDEAKSAFFECVLTDRTDLAEYYLAKAELKQIE